MIFTIMKHSDEVQTILNIAQSLSAEQLDLAIDALKDLQREIENIPYINSVVYAHLNGSFGRPTAIVITRSTKSRTISFSYTHSSEHHNLCANIQAIKAYEKLNPTIGAILIDPSAVEISYLNEDTTIFRHIPTDTKIALNLGKAELSAIKNTLPQVVIDAFQQPISNWLKLRKNI